MGDAATYGAVFLFALLAPAFAGGANPLPQGEDTPFLIVLGIGGAAGVGALLALTGNAIWQFFYPYTPGTGIDRPIFRLGKWRPSHFREIVAKQLGPYWDATNVGWSDGDRSLAATQFVFYEECPESVREWARRRNDRFVASLSASAAIVSGLLIGWLQWPGGSLLVIAILAVIAVMAALYGNQAHGQAQRMERYWFELRELKIEPKPDPKGA
jgi:hypothetical protein